MNNTTANGSYAFDEHLAIRVVRLVLYPVVFVIGVLGNILVCAVILGTKKKNLGSAKGYFILNLAMSDLLVLFLYLPFDLAYLENHSIWPFGFVLCKLINILSAVSVTVSGSMLICIGYERYLAIVKTLKSPFSKTKAVAMVTFGWVYSCLLQLPFVFALTLEPNGRCLIDIQWWPSQLSFNLTYIMALVNPQFIIPAFCLVYFYVGIISHLRKAHKQNNRRGIYTSVHVAEKRQKQNRKTTKLLTGLVLVYAACILPHKVIILSIIANPSLLNSYATRQLYEFARLLTTANSCFNPILYTTLSRSFRKDLKGLFSRETVNDSNRFLQSAFQETHPKEGANKASISTFKLRRITMMDTKESSCETDRFKTVFTPEANGNSWTFLSFHRISAICLITLGYLSLVWEWNLSWFLCNIYARIRRKVNEMRGKFTVLT